jgi:hypothetical protein
MPIVELFRADSQQSACPSAIAPEGRFGPAKRPVGSREGLACASGRALVEPCAITPERRKR